MSEQNEIFKNEARGNVIQVIESFQRTLHEYEISWRKNERIRMRMQFNKISIKENSNILHFYCSWVS